MKPERRYRERRSRPGSAFLVYLSLLNNAMKKFSLPSETETPVEFLEDLPGTRKKQAEALRRNLDYMAKTFRTETLCFVTISAGDYVPDASGRRRFVPCKDRIEAERRFHSFQVNVLKKMFRCGVVVPERHVSNGVHFHIVAVCGTVDDKQDFEPQDIRTGFDFERFDQLQADVVSGRRRGWKASEVGAGDYLANCWKVLRKRAVSHGFGARVEMLPARKNSDALAFYFSGYVAKDWHSRQEQDYGFRAVRYFGHWHPKARKLVVTDNDIKYLPQFKRPFNHKFSWNNPRAKAWRSMLDQFSVVCRSKGVHLVQDTMSTLATRNWAVYFQRMIKNVQFWVCPEYSEEVRHVIEEHNLLAEHYAGHVEVNRLEREKYKGEEFFRPRAEYEPNGGKAQHVYSLNANSLSSFADRALKVVKEAENALRRGEKRLRRIESAKRREWETVFDEVSRGDYDGDFTREVVASEDVENLTFSFYAN